MSDRLIGTPWLSNCSTDGTKIPFGKNSENLSWTKTKCRGAPGGLRGATKTIQTFINAYPSDLAFQVIIAFWIGLIFAPWSWGLLYLIIFFVVFEVIYAIIHRDFSVENILIRLTVIGASFLGWLVGRIVVEDGKPIRGKYKDKYCRLGCRKYEIPDHSEEVMEFDQVDKLKMAEYLNQLNLD